MSGLTLRDYQRDAMEAVLGAYRDGLRHPALSMSTGAGKTIVFSRVIEATGERSLVIAHRKELIEQAAQKIGYVIDPADVGIVMAERNQFGAPVVVASIQTIGGNRTRLARLGRFGLVVIDEAHHAISPVMVKTLEWLGALRDGPTKSLGVTATWDREDGLGFERVFDRIVYEIGMERLIAAGHLCDIQAIQIETHLDTTGIASNGRGDFSAEDLGRRIAASDYTDTLAAAVGQYARDRVSLVFAPNVRTAGDYRDAIRAVGIPCEMVDGETPRHERERIVAELRAGRIRAVTNCGVFLEGTDIPIVNCVVMGRPTKSRALYQQAIGRGMRVHPTKQDLLVLDLVGVSTRHKLQSVATLVGAAPGTTRIRSVRDALSTRSAGGAVEAKGALGATFVQTAKPIDVIDRSKLAWTQIDLDAFALSAGPEGQIVIREQKNGTFTVARYGRDRTKTEIGRGFDIGYAQGVAEQLVQEAGVTTLVNPKARWRREPATERQKMALAKWRIAYDDTITKGQAAELLDAAIARANLRRKGAVHAA